jgi:hypothetical protein
VVKGRWPGLFRRAIRGDRRAIDMAIYLVVPTRLLTRLAVTLATVFAMVSAPFALPGALVAAALAGEWLIPAYIGWKERLVKLSTGSLNVAVRHSMLSLLWFPIGIYALATARIRHWAPSARNVERDASNVA